MEEKNLVIIGSGPAAFTAAIYATRADLRPFVYEGFSSGPVGGQLMTTTVVENFPGFPKGILGAELMENFRRQAQNLGTEIRSEDVLSVDLAHYPFHVQGTSTKVKTKALIVATGAEAKRLDISGAGEGEFWQKGVTACAVCDGASPLFRNQDLYVIGGGDSAAEEALFLTRYAKRVFIVHRREELRASKAMIHRVQNHPKISILWNREMIRIEGDSVVRRVVLRDVKTFQEETREGAGVFFAIGHMPNSGFLKGQLELSSGGYIVVKPGTTLTSKEGVFAAGDVQDPIYRQAIVAAGSGCMAALDAEKWLSHKEMTA